MSFCNEKKLEEPFSRRAWEDVRRHEAKRGKKYKRVIFAWKPSLISEKEKREKGGRGGEGERRKRERKEKEVRGRGKWASEKWHTFLNV